MMLGNNSDAYYANRAAKERGMAERAIDPAIRKIHQEMATRYETLVQEAQPTLRMREAAG